jgi:hypothetical protein
VSEAAATVPATAVDLRRAPLATLRRIDFRAIGRDFWADQAAIWDRFRASWAGLDDAAWRLPGAAPSDAGGPDWSLLDHVSHVAHWQERAVDYVATAAATGRWPTDEDFEGGDFDRYNERHRQPWGSIGVTEVRARLEAGHDRLIASAGRLPVSTIRSDEAWGWVFLTLHGHQLDHLAVIEPWADALRERQARNDPFIAPDGEGTAPVGSVAAALGPFDAVSVAQGPTSAKGAAAELVAGFLDDADRALASWDDLVGTVPLAQWTAAELTPGWTLRDHVAHLADWFEEGAVAIETRASSGVWADGPAEGFDAWNARALERHAALGAAAIAARFDTTLGQLRAAIRSMPADLLASPEGWSWAYECLHGHVRAHLAMVGPWCARVGWPAPEEG